MPTAVALRFHLKTDPCKHRTYKVGTLVDINDEASESVLTQFPQKQEKVKQLWKSLTLKKASKSRWIHWISKELNEMLSTKDAELVQIQGHFRKITQKKTFLHPLQVNIEHN